MKGNKHLKKHCKVHFVKKKNERKIVRYKESKTKTQKQQ